ncbi:MAG TPA: amino acid dehydrogenase [Desulfobacteraceae bacterium]|nr:amino acid dehydrogenase [Desulfobacteraceae bacterium]|tara:strand:- start:373 stop:1620 length:1248 start_codon:yes stop_codon:yes gene_type:complete
MGNPERITIIGGGVIGLACAHYLLDEGCRVTIVERDLVGAGSSHGNCGLLYYSDALPLCTPGAVSKEIVRTLCGTSPLYVKPEPDFGRLFWLARFAGHCRHTHMRQAAKDKLPILQYSAHLFEALWQLPDMACELEKKGILYVFKEHKNFKKFGETSEYLDQFDLGWEPMTASQALELEPAFTDDIAGAWYSRVDHHLRPDLLMRNWRKHLVQKGLTVIENCSVLDFIREGGRLSGIKTTQGTITDDAFVLATGAWSSPLASKLKLKLPIQPGKGYSITMNRPEPCPSLPCILYEKNMVVTPWESGYRLGGTMEFSGFGTHLNQHRLNKLKSGAAEYMKSPYGTICQEEWTSLRPMTWDDMPVIDRAPGYENLVVATGHGMLGLTLATGTGKLVSDMLLNKPTKIPVHPYRMDRF